MAFLQLMPESPTAAGPTPAAASFPLPEGVSGEALLEQLRRLSWGAADILRAYARGEQPPYGFPAALQVEQGGEGPVSAADLAVNRWLLDGLSEAFPQAAWTLLS
jgi:3'(2'), 5'-bisphosphate nucleotidase